MYTPEHIESFHILTTHGKVNIVFEDNTMWAHFYELDLFEITNDYFPELEAILFEQVKLSRKKLLRARHDEMEGVRYYNVDVKWFGFIIASIQSHGGVRGEVLSV